MILDAQLQISSAQQVTADAVSTNDLDTDNVTPKRGIGAGNCVAIVGCITAAGTNSGDLKVQAIQSATATLSSGTQVIGQVSLAAAELAAGTTFVVPFSTGIPPLRYVGANYDVTGTVDVTISAWVVPREVGVALANFFARGYTLDLS